MSLNPKIEAITERIRKRSAPSRAAYLAGIDEAVRNGPNRKPLSCANTQPTCSPPAATPTRPACAAT